MSSTFFYFFLQYVTTIVYNALMPYDLKLMQRRREMMGLSPHRLARAAGITPNVVLNYERGNVKKPRPDVVKKLAAVLGLEMKELVVDE